MTTSAPQDGPTGPDAQALLRAVAQVVPTGFAVVDAGDRIAVANLAFVRAFDAPFGTTLVGLTVAEVSARSPFDRAGALWADRTSGPGRRMRCELPGGRLIDGAWHPLDLDPPMWAITVTDVTGEAHVRRRLRDHNRALAELVATRTELVSALLHELRTPLTAARAMAQMLPEASGDPLVDDVLGVVVRNLDRIGEVTDGIATVNGIENGTIDFRIEPVHVPKLLVDVAGRVSPSRLDVTADPAGPLLHGDPGRLAEAFERLAAAALAISGPDLTISVTATATHDRWTVRFPVPEQGAADRLFTTTGPHSNATALMLARAVFGRHGGTLQVETQHGVPCLTVRLPVRSPVAAGSAATVTSR